MIQLIASCLRAFIGVMFVVLIVSGGILGGIGSLGGSLIAGFFIGAITSLIVGVISFGTIAVLFTISDHTEQTENNIKLLLAKMDSLENLYSRTAIPDSSTKTLSQQRKIRDEPAIWEYKRYEIKDIDGKLAIVDVDTGDAKFQFVDDAKRYIDKNLPDKLSSS